MTRTGGATPAARMPPSRLASLRGLQQVLVGVIEVLRINHVAGDRARDRCFKANEYVELTRLELPGLEDCLRRASMPSPRSRNSDRHSCHRSSRASIPRRQCQRAGSCSPSFHTQTRFADHGTHGRGIEFFGPPGRYRTAGVGGIRSRGVEETEAIVEGRKPLSATNSRTRSSSRGWRWQQRTSARNPPRRSGSPLPGHWCHRRRPLPQPVPGRQPRPGLQKQVLSSASLSWNWGRHCAAASNRHRIRRSLTHPPGGRTPLMGGTVVRCHVTITREQLGSHRHEHGGRPDRIR